MKRKAVSPVIAELLLLVILVAMGSIVVVWAYTGFNSVDNAFGNQLQQEGNQLEGNLVLPYAHLNVNGGMIYIQNPSPITQDVVSIQMTNQTCTFSPLSLTVTPQMILPVSAICHLQANHFYQVVVISAQGDHVEQEFEAR